MDGYALDDFQMEQVQTRLWDCRDAGIRDFLNSLSYNPRRLIELRYGLADGHRYSVEETADVLAKPANWVLTIESYALYELYQYLAPEGQL